MVWSIIGLIHNLGLAFGVGGATANLALMMKSRSDKEFTPVFMKASEPIAKLTFLGLILLTLSGIGFFVLGYPEKQLLLLKHILVAVLWVSGLLMMFVYQPRLGRLAPKPGQPPTTEFFSVQKIVQALGMILLILWYAITIMSTLL
jgi:hypothetical protein